MSYVLPKQRGSNVTIIGAITNMRDKIFFHVGNTTNIVNVMAFFEYLDNQINLKDSLIHKINQTLLKTFVKITNLQITTKAK